MSEENSIRDDIEAAMSAAEEVVESEEVTEPEVDETEEVVVEEHADDRPRDEKGRFKAKEPESGDEPDPEKAANPDAEQEPEKETEAEQVLPPPNGWPADAKAKWHELDPVIQAAVAKREQDVAKFTSKSDSERQFGIDMQKAVGPYMAQIQAEGATPAQAVQSLLNTAYILRNGSPDQKKAALLGAAQQYGVDLSDTEMPKVDPNIAALHRQVAQLQGVLTQQQQGATTELKNQVEQEIEAFRTDPANAYFDEVRAHMGALMRQDDSLSLKDAYDRACWANPDIRATLQAQQRMSEEQKRKAEAKARADEAKRKAVSITGGPGSTSDKTAPENRSLRDELKAQMAAQSGAV